jgi:hypothetical protein
VPHRRLRAAGVAGALGGVPSTLWALRAGTDPLVATEAAGALLCPAGSRRPRLAAAVLVHGALTIGWTVVLDAALPTRRPRLHTTALAGALIAAVDLGVAHVVPDQRFAAIRALPVVPQVADHIAFAVLAGVVLRPRG